MMTRIPLSARLLPVLAVLLATTVVHAQDCGMTFGPPLRDNMLFAYKYTERVRAVYETPGDNGPIRDSSERLLTYFITERQIPSLEGKGLLRIEANIDSMQVEYSSGDESFTFDSQKQAEKYVDIRHRELLVPSALVNRLAIFTISPYGEVLKVEGPILNIREQVSEQQVKEGLIDEFTRARGLAITSQEYLTSVFFAWRGVVPVGATVVCGRPVKIGSGVVLDRIPFSDQVQTTFSMQGENRRVNYTGLLKKPVVGTFTINSFRDPLSIVSVQGTLSGGLELDQDGVVREGWSTARGTIVGKVDQMKVNGTLSHEVFISRLWISPFSWNDAP